MKHFAVTFKREWSERGVSNISAHSEEQALEIARNRLAENRKIEWDMDQTLEIEEIIKIKEVK